MKNRIKLALVLLAALGFVAFAWGPQPFDPTAQAQGKKGAKGKAAAKVKPTPTPTPAKPPPPPRPTVAPPKAPPTNSGTGTSPAMPPAMVKPPTASDAPGTVTPTMVKPPTASDTPSTVTPTMVKPPTASETPQPVKPVSDGAARKGPKPPAGNVPGIVGVRGKAVPYAGLEEPTEPLLFSNDNDAKFIAKAAFDHNKHSREATYSVTGTAVSTCAECHHADQAATTPGVPSYYKLFERKGLLTSATLASEGQAVSSCRVCHLSSREAEVEGYPPEGVAYPDSESDKRDVYGDKALNSEIAYHINCIVCHERAKKARPTYQFKFLPTNKCTDCHTKAS